MITSTKSHVILVTIFVFSKISYTVAHSTQYHIDAKFPSQCFNEIKIYDAGTLSPSFTLSYLMSRKRR